MYAAHCGRRLLPVDAAVPLERADGGMGPGAGGRGDGRAAGRRAVLGVGLPARRPAVRRRPTSTTSASRWRTSWPRPSGPTTPTTRSSGRSATRGPSTTSPGSPSASAARSPTPTARPRAGRRCNGTPDTPRGALGRAPRGHRGRRLGRHRRGVPAGPLRRTRAAASTPRRPSASSCARPAGPGFEGYWHNDEAEAGPAARRLVLDGRPRLPRRGRASSTSPAATTTGSGWTARTSRRRRSSGSWNATPTSSWPRSTPCRTRWSATR